MKPEHRIVALFLLAFVHVPQCSVAQVPYGFKEKYDAQDPYLTGGPFTYSGPSTIWFHSWGWTLMGYLRLYQTTGDQAYLIKFVKHSKGLQNRRQPGIYPEWPIWVDDMDDDQWMHYNSELALPMCEYVYIVLNEPELFDMQIPTSAVDQPFGFVTHGEYALWLRYRLLETLEHFMDEHWIDNHYCASSNRPSSCERECVTHSCIHGNHECPFLPCGCVHPASLNAQADLAVALYYLAASYGPSAAIQLSRANFISEYFLGEVEVLSGTNANVWRSDPDAAWDDNVDDLEDVAHGASCVQIPLASYRLHGMEVFSLVDLEQFAATFSENIWDSDAGVFRGTVHGTDYANTDSDPIPTNLYATGEIFSWMPLHEFDVTPAPNDIYTVITKQARLLLENDDDALLPSTFTGTQTRIFGGVQPYYGLSEVVKAQWQRECVDLTLYNRDLVYDQDFATRHVLTVDPRSGPFDDVLTASFADPIITDPHFTVREGITTQFRAGAAVVWEPGFEAEYGSHVEAVIDPAGCELVVHMGLQGSEAQANEDKRVQFPTDAFARDHARMAATGVAPKQLIPLSVAPNPASTQALLRLSAGGEGMVTWQLFNSLGRVVRSPSAGALAAGAQEVTLEIAGCASGAYTLRVDLGGRVEQLRLVVVDP